MNVTNWQENFLIGFKFSYHFFYQRSRNSSDSNRNSLILTSLQYFFNVISDDEWEKDLAAEIQDFEVVDDHNVDESELDDLK